MLTWFKNQVRGDAADFEDTASLCLLLALFEEQLFTDLQMFFLRFKAAHNTFLHINNGRAQ